MENNTKNNNKQKTQTQPNVVPLNELNLKVINAGNVELINESGNTVMCYLMQDDGKVLTSFMGDYNKEIIKTLQRVTKIYFKSLKKQLFGKKKENKQVNNSKKEDKPNKVKNNKKLNNEKENKAN